MECVQEEIKSASLKAAFDHWSQAKGDQLMPRRGDIDPLKMVEALPYAWIYRLNDEGEFFCALAGAKIETAWGHSIMNRPALEIVGPNSYTRIRRRWRFLLEEPAILYSELMESPLARPVERLVMPVANKEGVPIQVLGISHYFYPQADSYKLPIRSSDAEANFYRATSYERIHVAEDF